MKASAAVRGLMRPTVVDPRPYPEPFQPVQRAVIEEAILQGLDSILNDGEVDVSTVGEVDLTRRLISLLNRMLEADPPVIEGFTKAQFQTVTRGSELESHDGAHIEMRPDMQFRPTRPLPALAHPEQCALFVECKVVDRDHTMALYGGAGISRFVRGDYAWAVPSAMMLGYARHAYRLPKHLKDYLDRNGATVRLVGELRRRPAAAGAPPIYVTVHDRDVPSLPKGPARHITLHHVWVTLEPRSP